MGWARLHETERGAAVWRIFWEAGFLPRPADAPVASLGGMAGGAVGDSKITKVFDCVAQVIVFPRVPMKLICVDGGEVGPVVWSVSSPHQDMSYAFGVCSGPGNGHPVGGCGVKMRPRGTFSASSDQSEVRKPSIKSTLLASRMKQRKYLPDWVCCTQILRRFSFCLVYLYLRDSLVVCTALLLTLIVL